MTQEREPTAQGAPEHRELVEQREVRIQRLERLRAAGVDGYGGRFAACESIAAARDRYAAAGGGEPAAEIGARVAGRVRAYRAMGKAIFADIEDESGRIQLFVQRDVVGDGLFALFRLVDLADWLGVEGVLFTTRTGEVTIRVARFELLCKALRPMPEKWHGLRDIEKRHRQRYLDLAAHPPVRELFRTRSRIVREMRRFMDSRGFMEVETPMMQPIPGGAAARPFVTHHEALGADLYLRIAPELYLKRLLVGGFQRIYEINRNFRNEGLSRRHNPEFTMLEAYEAFGDCRTMMDLVEALVLEVADAVIGGRTLAQPDGREVHLEPPWRRARYDELVAEAAGRDWRALDAPARERRAAELGVAVEAGLTEAELANQVFEKLVEPNLIDPTFVIELPAELVPLARYVPGDPRHVDVFELVIGGQEIAPGYSELNDPLLQRQRFEEQALARRAAGGEDADPAHRLDEDFLTAIEHGMPPAGGMGLGVDRLAVILTGAESIRDVILFPQMRPLAAAAPSAPADGSDVPAGAAAAP